MLSKKNKFSTQSIEKTFFSRNKKCISPVVATALLLIVAVVAVVGFQGWFQTYSSVIFVKTEQESKTSSQTSIETIVGNQLYVKGGVNTSIKEILIDGNLCSFSGNISSVQNISVEDCLNQSSTRTPEIVVVLKDRVISKKVYLKDIKIDNFDENVISHLKSESECRFKDNKSGCEDYYIETQVDGIDVIEDTLLGLYWQKNMSLNGNWTDAHNYCSGIGDGNWRLPTLVELEVSLVDTSRSSDPYIVDAGFINVQDWYWTDTRYDSSGAYIVYFDYGYSNYIDVSDSSFFICVKTAS